SGVFRFYYMTVGGQSRRSTRRGVREPADVLRASGPSRRSTPVPLPKRRAGGRGVRLHSPQLAIVVGIRGARETARHGRGAGGPRLRAGRQPHISQAVVIGDNRKYCVALITLDLEEIGRWAEVLGVGQVFPHPAVGLFARERGADRQPQGQTEGRG